MGNPVGTLGLLSPFATRQFDVGEAAARAGGIANVDQGSSGGRDPNIVGGGDFAVLAERGRRALRVHLGKDVAAGLAMAFKLIESAQRRWRMVNAPHLVALVRAGATFGVRE